MGDITGFSRCSFLCSQSNLWVQIRLKDDFSLVFSYSHAFNGLYRVFVEGMSLWRLLSRFKTMFAYKRSDWSSSWHQQYKLTIELLSFFFFFFHDSKFEIKYKDLMKQNEQSDVCFLIADIVSILCSYMRTLSLTNKFNSF